MMAKWICFVGISWLERVEASFVLISKTRLFAKRVGFVLSTTTAGDCLAAGENSFILLVLLCLTTA